ncbi:hypothetical protein [Streptomyces sp. NPDC048521]
MTDSAAADVTVPDPLERPGGDGELWVCESDRITVRPRPFEPMPLRSSRG